MVSTETLKRRWIGIDLSAKACELVNSRLKKHDIPLSPTDFHLTSSIPTRSDIEREMAQAAAERMSLKNALYSDQEGLCILCHTYFDHPRHFHMDHIVPHAKGGRDWIYNFQLLCGSCNSIKSDGTQEQARARLAELRGINLSEFD